MSEVDVYRDALFGNPPSPTTQPSREGSLAAFTALFTRVISIVSGVRSYPTVASLPASTDDAPVGTQARVYADPVGTNNTYWIRQSSGWVIDQGYIDSVASVAEEYVDDAQGAAGFALRSQATAFAPKLATGETTTVYGDSGTHPAVSGEVRLDETAATVGETIPNNGGYTKQSGGAILRTRSLGSQKAAQSAIDAAAQVPLAAAQATKYPSLKTDLGQSPSTISTQTVGAVVADTNDSTAGRAYATPEFAGSGYKTQVRYRVSGASAGQIILTQRVGSVVTITNVYSVSNASAGLQTFAIPDDIPVAQITRAIYRPLTGSNIRGAPASGQTEQYVSSVDFSVGAAVTFTTAPNADVALAMDVLVLNGESVHTQLTRVDTSSTKNTAYLGEDGSNYFVNTSYGFAAVGVTPVAGRRTTYVPIEYTSGDTFQGLQVDLTTGGDGYLVVATPSFTGSTFSGATPTAVYAVTGLPAGRNVVLPSGMVAPVAGSIVGWTDKTSVLAYQGTPLPPGDPSVWRSTAQTLVSGNTEIDPAQVPTAGVAQAGSVATGYSPNLRVLVSRQKATVTQLLAGATGGAEGKQALSTAGNSLWRYRGKMARLLNGETGVVAKILFVGSSSSDYATIPQAVLDRVLAKTSLTRATTGRFSFSALGNMAGQTYTLGSGWTSESASGAVTGILGADLQAKVTATAGATATLSGIRGTSFVLSVSNADPAFSYTVNGGAPVPVAAGTGAATRRKITIPLDSAIANTIVITTGGAMRLLDGYATGATGVEVSKMGCSGSQTVTWQSNIATVTPYITDYAPDVVVVYLSGNDRTANVDPTVYASRMGSVVAAIKAASPGSAIVLVSQPRTDATITFAWTAYRDQLVKLANTDAAYEHLDFMTSYDTWANENANGMFLDANHQSAAGGRRMSSAWWEQLLWTY